MPYIVPGHSAYLALIEHVVDRCPVHRTGLCLHHPEVLSEKATRKVVGKAITNRIEMSLAYVVVPRCKIEVLTHGVVIVAIEQTHHVRGDELGATAVSADRIYLQPLIG